MVSAPKSTAEPRKKGKEEIKKSCQYRQDFLVLKG
jgi:hypothetical protein